MEEKNQCSFRCGKMPDCAPLAAAYVPVQSAGSPQYDAREGLNKGTLFPGLNLPFMNQENKGNPYAGTPMGELMALGFAVGELNLYLDTHGEDREAFEMMKKLIELYEAGKKEYRKKYGPICLADMADAEKYDWAVTPWPWEYREADR